MTKRERESIGWIAGDLENALRIPGRQYIEEAITKIIARLNALAKKGGNDEQKT
jgi:hypothetical protein